MIINKTKRNEEFIVKNKIEMPMKKLTTNKERIKWILVSIATTIFWLKITK